MKKFMSITILLIISLLVVACGSIPKAIPTQSMDQMVAVQLTAMSINATTNPPAPTNVPPTRIPPTPIPIIKGIDKEEYSTKMISYATDLGDELNTFSVLLTNADTSNLMDQSWITLVYGCFDNIVEISYKMAHEEVPNGWEDLQEYLLSMYEEFAAGRSDFHKGIDNFDVEAINATTQHINNANIYVLMATTFLENHSSETY